MIDGMYIKVDSRNILQAYANLKNLPLAKIIHNASKDFAQAAQERTPKSQLLHAKYYKAYIPGTGKHWFIPIEWLNGRRVYNKRSRVKLVKWLKRGWSKATWIGIMRALGMTSSKAPLRSSDSTHAQMMSHVILHKDAVSAHADMTDEVYFDQWTRGTDYTSEPVIKSGFALASKRIANDFNNVTRAKWLGQFK